MSRVIIINAIRFIVLIFIQAFLLKNIGYYNLSTPFIYILFILLLPFETPNWLLFPLAFLTGLTVDAFYNTPGLNAAACSVLAFVRTIFINITVQRQGFENEPEPKLGIMGFRWFFFYTIILTLFHHLTLIFLEAFSFSSIKYTLIRFLFCSLFTIFLILISEFIFFRKKER
ncbi:rod shape-determining protein MreD [Pararcticibacter amylolyticus]|uniref:Rod shape-determining protein MreD n=1 Tax=Pararcticibacter amylolyticus TaxID=2173175 RepID=A0A2U2PF09_9SPHI|nr:rod shape-determining protein MreD [Pararcticibacter amylolyticus]PWG79981.1 rod shape-determining protein MreD [Pararcticibacter amylolyticus]